MVTITHITSFPEDNGHFQILSIKGPEKQLLYGVQACPLYLKLSLWYTPSKHSFKDDDFVVTLDKED